MSPSRGPNLAVADQRGKAARGLGGLPQAAGTLRRHHRGPQCQYLGLRLAQHRRSHGREPRSTSFPQRQAAPIYVVDRTDIVRIYVDVPERDANYVHIGSEARVKLWAYRDEWLPAAGHALWPGRSISKSRTMRAEIDMPNPNSQILPGMYAYGEVVVERPTFGAAQVGHHPRRRQVVRLAL